MATEANTEPSSWVAIKRLGIIVALLTALMELHLLIQDARSTLDAIKLESLNQVLPLIDSDYEIRKLESEFVNTEIDLASKSLTEEYLAKGKSGKDFYLSDEAKNFRSVAGHYEKLGSILKLGYLEFDIIFDIVPFPEAFWHNTAELRQGIKANWAGPNKPLADFLANFQWLCAEYKKARSESGDEAGAQRLKCSDS